MDLKFLRCEFVLGTVWVNALMNKTMKVAKADEKGEKLRVSFGVRKRRIGIVTYYDFS